MITLYLNISCNNYVVSIHLILFQPNDTLEKLFENEQGTTHILVNILQSEKNQTMDIVPVAIDTIVSN